MMGGTLSTSTRSAPELEKPRLHIRMATLIEWARGPGLLNHGQIMHLIAEVIRLRLKVRYQKRRILDLEGAPFELDLHRARKSDPPPAPVDDISPAVEEALGP